MTPPRTEKQTEDQTEDQTGDLSYEQAREELVETVRRLEAGGTTLEESLTLWERGEELARICQQRLDGARRRLDAAVAAGGDPSGAAAGEAEGDAARRLAP